MQPTRADRKTPRRHCRRALAFRAIRHQGRRRKLSTASPSSSARRSAKKLGVRTRRSCHNRPPAKSRIRPPTTNGTWRSCRSTRSARNSSISATPIICCRARFWWRPAPRSHSVKDADAKGIGIGGVANTATFRAAIKIDAATPPTSSLQGRRHGDRGHERGQDRRDRVVAGVARPACAENPRLAHSCPTRFLNSTTAVCVPKGKPAALAYVSEFIEEAKASGLVRKRARRDGAEIVARRAGGDEKLAGRRVLTPASPACAPPARRVRR